MIRRQLMVGILMVFGLGCAHGKMGNVEQGLEAGSLDKSTLIMVEPIDAKETTFSGDKSADKPTTDAARARIESEYNGKIVEALRKAGFNAQAAEGPVKKGVVLSGKVTKIENGSAAARYFVGMGAGSANMYTSFKLEDRSQKKPLSKFEIIGTSGGEGGLGSLGGYLTKHLTDSSKKTAEYLDKSLKGQVAK